ncbi:ferredoxin [Sporosarcina sp. BP05]|uniref:ferredoxin n=1 Tax=Sporosarcina sp. BP05 TaxID=2758726 RepID=UPI001644078F|nr:ferredoxin [Sporosarcina sp. BP05]
MANFTMVDQSTCIACGVCGELAPDLFKYRDDGISYSILDENTGVTEVSEDLLEDLEDAHDSCPTSSIKMADTPFDCQKDEAS